MLLCAISLWIFDYETQVIDEGSKCIIEYVLHIALMRDSWIIHSFYFFPIKSVSRKKTPRNWKSPKMYIVPVKVKEWKHSCLHSGMFKTCNKTKCWEESEQMLMKRLRFHEFLVNIRFTARYHISHTAW